MVPATLRALRGPGPFWASTQPATLVTASGASAPTQHPASHDLSCPLGLPSGVHTGNGRGDGAPACSPRAQGSVPCLSGVSFRRAPLSVPCSGPILLRVLTAWAVRWGPQFGVLRGEFAYIPLSTGREGRSVPPAPRPGPSSCWGHQVGITGSRAWSRSAGSEAHTILEVFFRNKHKITNTYLE